MTTNATGLRDAAERLNEYVTREIDDFIDEAAELDENMGEELRQVLKDTATLSKHYLAAHPASEEPITEEWLLSIGFSKAGINGFSILLPPANPRAAITELVVGFKDSCYKGEWPVDLIQGYPDDPKAGDDHVSLTSVSMKTRPQLLHLLAALGCEVDQLTNSGKVG